MKDKKNPVAAIAENKKARHEYFIEDTLEAGLVLEGWEIKSLRKGKAQITDAYVIFKNGEAWLLGAQITPLSSVSTHIRAEADRTRKLLLNKKEIAKLIGLTQQKGFSCVPLKLYWKSAKVKCLIATAKGKKLHDKRETDKKRDWQKEKARLLKNQVR